MESGVWILTGDHGTETIGISQILDSHSQTLGCDKRIGTLNLLLLLLVSNVHWHSALLAMDAVLRLIVVGIGARSVVHIIVLLHNSSLGSGDVGIVLLVEAIVETS